jgi:hypothetical protein
MHSLLAYQTTLPNVPQGADFDRLADRVFRQVFRHDFTEPGFALVSLSSSVSSTRLRRFMVALKDALSDRNREAHGRPLAYLSMGRFDQRESTKFHRDGGPDESYLMLGYEPTYVRSELTMADYTLAATDLGLDPKQFLDDHNPIFDRGEALLAPYVTSVAGFNPTVPLLLLINNSALPYSEGGANSLGVLHRATILTPLPSLPRIVHSTMIAPADDPGVSPLGPEEVRAFVEADGKAMSLSP